MVKIYSEFLNNGFIQVLRFKIKNNFNDTMVYHYETVQQKLYISRSEANSAKRLFRLLQMPLSRSFCEVLISLPNGRKMGQYVRSLFSRRET